MKTIRHHKKYRLYNYSINNILELKPKPKRRGGKAVFLFLFSFFIKIYFRFGNLQKYIPAAPLSGGRDLAARQRGGRGISKKISQKKLHVGP